MIKVNDIVKVHIYGTDTNEIITRNHDKEFIVREENGQLGIDWNTERSPYTCKGNVFNPFYTFSTNVIFENVETGECYYWSNLINGIERINPNLERYEKAMSKLSAAQLLNLPEQAKEVLKRTTDLNIKA